MPNEKYVLDHSKAASSFVKVLEQQKYSTATEQIYMQHVRESQIRAARVPIPLVGGAHDGMMYGSHLHKISIPITTILRNDVNYFYSDDSIMDPKLGLKYDTYVKMDLFNWTRSSGGPLKIYLYEPLTKSVHANQASPTLSRLVEKSLAKAFIQDQMNRFSKEILDGTRD